jgi:hypothetical protein
MNRATVIALSLRAFVCGIFGFLPIIGLVPAVCALTCWFRVRSGFHPEWNPAGRYLNLGAILGGVGILAAFLTGLCIAISAYLT